MVNHVHIMRQCKKQCPCFVYVLSQDKIKSIFVSVKSLYTALSLKRYSKDKNKKVLSRRISNVLKKIDKKRVTKSFSGENLKVKKYFSTRLEWTFPGYLLKSSLKIEKTTNKIHSVQFYFSRPNKTKLIGTEWIEYK